jgi:hypothetical protein
VIEGNDARSSWCSAIMAKAYSHPDLAAEAAIARSSLGF